MTVEELIRDLIENFEPKQEVFIIERKTISYTTAKPLYSVDADTVGRSKAGQCFVGALGPEACILSVK
jgi:hypothetical protein